MNRPRRNQNNQAQKAIDYPTDDEKEDQKSSNTMPVKFGCPVKPSLSQLTFAQDSEETIKRAIRNPINKNIYIAFTKVHYALKLRYDTLFLAVEIYTTYLKEKGSMGPNSLYLVAGSMFLAMKYEEIYPVSIMEIIQIIFKKEICLVQYFKAEINILHTVKMNLNIHQVRPFLEKSLMAMSESTKFHCYYLLELSFVDKNISSRYSLEEICNSIIYLLVQDQEIDFRMPESKRIAENCSKLLIAARMYARQKARLLFEKYSSKNYHSVALRHLKQRID